jgi:hypothetical protein
MQSIKLMSTEIENKKDVRLIIHIENKQPIELMDLTKSLVSLASQFNDFVKTTANVENREAKLYVKQIKTGSVILDLIEIATAGALPFIENINTIVGFADYLKNGFKYFLGDKSAKNPEFSTKDCTEFSQIVNPIAKDNGSQFNISTTINGDVTNILVMSSLEANAFQNIIKAESKQMSLPEQKGDYEKVVMYFDTTKSNIKADTGNKAIIETIDKKPAKVIFDTDDLKEKILKSDENPLITAFVVNVKVETVKDKIAAYKVMSLHETFPLDDAL